MFFAELSQSTHTMRNIRPPPITHENSYRSDDFKSSDTFLGPGSPESPQSLKKPLPFRRVLLRHQSVLWAHSRYEDPPPSPHTRKTVQFDPITKHNSIMVIKVKGLKDKWRGTYFPFSPVWVAPFSGNANVGIFRENQISGRGLPLSRFVSPAMSSSPLFSLPLLRSSVSLTYLPYLPSPVVYASMKIGVNMCFVPAVKSVGTACQKVLPSPTRV